jgi:hypothetical protein
MSDQAKSEEEKLWAEMQAAEAKTDGQIAEKPKDDNDVPSDDLAAAPDQAAATPPTPAPDIWANAPEDLKAAHDQQVKALETATTEHARRSIEGRIVAYTRRLNERNAAAAQQPPAATEEAADPLAEIAAEYPEIVTPFQKKTAAIEEQISQFKAVEQGRQAAADAEMDANLLANEQLLAQRHPGWVDYLKQHGAVFGAWIADQPLAMRESFVINKDAIVNPYSAIETLDAFKSFVEANQPPQQVQQPAVAQQQRLNSRRTAQLASSASPATVGHRPTVSGIPESGDDQQIWNAFRDIDPEERKYRNA